MSHFTHGRLLSPIATQRRIARQRKSRADQEEVDAKRASEPASGIAKTSFDATHVANDSKVTADI